MRAVIGADWRRFLGDGIEAGEIALIERHVAIGRPLGGDDFIAELERRLGRALGKRKPGRKPGPVGDGADRAPDRFE